MPRFARPALLAALVLATAACDSGSDVLPLGGRLYVTLEGTNQMKLEADLDLPCGPRIVTEQQLVGGRFQVNVLGTEAPAGMCDGVAPVRRTLTIETGNATRVPVDIQFGGIVDEYVYVAARPGPPPMPARLDSIRTTVTIPRPRPRTP